MKVQGYAAKAPGKALEAFEYDAPKLGDSEVLVDISHCGLCYTDVHCIDNDFGMTQYPFVPGHEIVGTVAMAGKAVRTLNEGQRVGIGCQRGSCGHCEWCVRGEENLCPEYMGNLTFFPYGGFASAIVVDARFAFPLPDALDSEHAGPLLCGGATVYSPLQSHCVRPSMRVGVVGIGGLGHMALQFARAFGCEVTAISSTPAKEREAREFGAHHFLLSGDEEGMKKEGASLDFIICTAHAPLPWNSILGTLRKNGTLCLVGLNKEDVTFSPVPVIVNQLSICGSMIAGRAVISEMLDFAARASVRPKVETLPMVDVNKAVARLKEGRARYRIVLTR
jgi:uncharacterized zinc-type alcohol dehydrogenase-like protein